MTMDLTEATNVIRIADHRRALVFGLAVKRARALGYGMVAAVALGRAARMALGQHEDPEHCALRVVRVPRRSATQPEPAA